MDETLPPMLPRATHLFKPGQSGNPKGRPKGSKNQLTELKLALELAVRDNIDPEAVRKILDAMALKAIEGNVGAAKLILDKLLTNAKDHEESHEGQGDIVFRVQNMTLKHPDERPVIDITPPQETENVSREETAHPPE